MQRRKARRTDQDMLEKLGKVFQERGYLSAKTIAEAKGLMSSQAYKHRFGGLLGAYRRVGHTPERDYRFVQFARSRKHSARTIVEQITAASERAGAAVHLDTKQGRLTINGELDLVVRAARCLTSDAGSHRWNIVFEHEVVWDLLLVGRMDYDNTGIRDIYVFPRSAKWPCRMGLRETNDFSIDCYRFDKLDDVIGLIQRTTFKEAP
jgi:hypothetical protein